MGKPSSTRLSRESRDSISKHSMNSTISKKSSIKKRKGRSKTRNSITRNSIQKVLERLTSDHVSANNSISSTNSENITAIDLNNTTILPKKHLRNGQNSNSLIVIGDDEDLVTNNGACNFNNMKNLNSPIHCSTPIKCSASSNKCATIPSSHNTDKNVQFDTVTAQNLNEQIVNLTEDRDSYLTIDLTTDSELPRGSASKTHSSPVIDLVNSAYDQDCMLTSMSDASLSMSGDSDVTVLNKFTRKSKNEPSKQMRRFVKGISKLGAKEKGNLLKLITQTIFSGCDVQNSSSILNIKERTSRGTETAEDTFIKEVILGQAASRNSIGSNIYNPERDLRKKTGLRMIVIDGSNVAMQHSMGRVFSVKGLKICIDYFVKRGHVVKAFVPRFRCKFGKSTDPRLLDTLERQGLVIYTPSREIQGKIITSYDDRYIVQCAAEFDGVIVSGDNYRDLLIENPRWRFIIENRLLIFTWVGDMIMFPKDPLGRNGPSLEQFLKY